MLVPRDRAVRETKALSPPIWQTANFFSEADTRAPENLLCISVGLEHADDLIADLKGALR